MPITHLPHLIKSMQPRLHEGDYIFATVEDISTIPRTLTIAEFKEAEGTTVILAKQDAERLQIDFDFVAAWIILEVHSALEAVGLTAAFSTELAKHNISCNVMAGYYHDHIFVAKKDGERAVTILKKMSASAQKTKITQPVPQLPVADVEKAQQYYRDILGFDIAWIYPNKQIGAVTRGEVAIFFAKTNSPISPNIHWIFTEKVDDTYEEFKQRGATIIEEIENKPWNLRQFAITDLNGHIFYFHHDL